MTREPTLVDIPAILFRTVMRAAARLVFACAGVLLLLGLGLAIISVFIATFHTPRTRRTQALAELLVAAIQVIKQYK
jgi:hypothetical protein